jgi:acyl-ACP thioesterase
MFSALVLAFIFVRVSVSVAPGDEEAARCEELRAYGVVPTPSYFANMRVLMDSWNYENLLRTGAVWDQVDNDTNNPSGATTNVSCTNI